jgi:hypothetical protein
MEYQDLVVLVVLVVDPLLLLTVAVAVVLPLLPPTL